MTSRGGVAAPRRWLVMAAEISDRAMELASGLDRDALVARLFRAEGASLVRLARLFADDRNAAEDLVQESFIRLHRSAHRIKDPEKAAQYLRSILMNLTRDHNRRGLMSLRHQEALTGPADPNVPDDLLALDAERAEMIEAVRALSPRQRDCLLLRYYAELSEREAAAVLGISANSVKTHCRRGLVALRVIVEEEQ